MKIGDSVLVYGVVDEIRKDVVIIRNKGGYFGTVKSEIYDADNLKQIRDANERKHRLKEENVFIRCAECENWVPDDENCTMYCGQEILPTPECATGYGFCSMAERREDL